MVTVIAQPKKQDSKLSVRCILFKSINLLKNENVLTIISRTIVLRLQRISL